MSKRRANPALTPRGAHPRAVARGPSGGTMARTDGRVVVDIDLRRAATAISLLVSPGRPRLVWCTTSMASTPFPHHRGSRWVARRLAAHGPEGSSPATGLVPEGSFASLIRDSGGVRQRLNAQVATLRRGVVHQLARRRLHRDRAVTITSRRFSERTWPRPGSVHHQQAHLLFRELLDRRNQAPRRPRRGEPLDGSSMISTRGFVTSARPIARICCSPPDSKVPLTCLRSASRGNRS